MKFYIVCPANTVTGGPELLHQFSHLLTQRGIENYMLYINVEPGKCPTPEPYLKYQVKYVAEYVDEAESVLVLSEIFVHLIDICKQGCAVIWWLSVDNYKRQYKKLIEGNCQDIFELAKRNKVLHFVQSCYAWHYVVDDLGVNKPIYYMKDYINDDIMELANRYRNVGIRRNVCLYNPRKGYDKLEPIIKACDETITWLPLVGLTSKEIAMLMCTSKCYIDFGSHPGKDRIPREAALCGCCVLTNQMGSAAFSEDVNIPNGYKVMDMTDVQGVLGKIYDIMEHFDDRQKDFQKYCFEIKREKQEFIHQVDQMCVIVQRFLVCEE